MDGKFTKSKTFYLKDLDCKGEEVNFANTGSQSKLDIDLKSRLDFQPNKIKRVML